MDSQGQIALLVLFAVTVLFVTDKMPISTVALLGGIAMAAFGIIPPLQVFSGLSSSAVLYLIGMGIITQALIAVGFVEQIKKLFIRNRDLDEKRLILLFIIVFALISGLFPGIIVMLMIMPVINAVEKKPGNTITRKHVYMPLAFGALYGGNLTIIGSSSMVNAVSQIQEYTGQQVSFWATTTMGLACVCSVVLFYLTIGYQLQKKVFNFASPPNPYQDATSISEITLDVWKYRVVIGIFCGCIVGFLSGVDTGFIAMAGAALLMLTRCIDPTSAFRGVDWVVVFTVVGCFGIAKGIEASGAGVFLAKTIIETVGAWGDSPYVMCIVMLFISTVLSNFMSNNAAVMITVPIALSIATLLNSDSVLFGLACGVGANLSCATPLATTVMAITTSAGYRFRDYLIIGGIVNALGFIAVALVIGVLFFINV